jgi:DNA-binding NtrC family response regulator
MRIAAGAGMSGRDEHRWALLERQLIGISAPMQRVREALIDAARRRDPVLLRGEKGTGKTRAAHLLHALAESGKPLLTLANGAAKLVGGGAALSANLLAAARAGRTLLVEEIGDAPLFIQDVLLSACRLEPTLRDRHWLLATTSRDLEALAQRSRFRKELLEFFGAGIWLPPLRMRRVDIAPLARTFSARRKRVIADDAVKALEACRWPGNTSQLELAIDELVSAYEHALTAREVEQWIERRKRIARPRRLRTAGEKPGMSRP